ncbi:hypothetical protein NQ317_011228 [Molorchus minor]|uniref:THAP-type domain-containing protein n=1 Tax=Molorchus minor TaxID=1323400 RepID=A0ABQ9IX87_9CUCU|nr:hypothetical protein NQ317_011228 [Molorchus minor]
MFKECFVPTCTNNNINWPSKIFVYVPRDEKRRKSWFEKARVEKKLTKTSSIYCCEDHFDLQEDSENWFYYKTIGSNLILKKDAVPHRNMEARVGHLQSPDQVSQLTSSERKRKSEILTSLSSIKKYKKTIIQDT